ncbi:Prophage CP4-57 regulatory [Sphingobium chlorophenolicum L-1]|uniref:Prophage CP4-57 regulatory n=1 Tax=Sphingobium chlorophenolicum L-1 TaxID=690566 RepID=F6F0A4_SPHCR|nr:AlpA family phage regulatory protein [Sphingobium chlorophenolicum]AEG50328.1 Prophage CP4-57 regulatory [Sphingobium chlorophenolicum L-1]
MEITMTVRPPEPLLRLNTILARTGLSQVTLYRKIQAGTFPKQIRIANQSAINDWSHNPMFWSAGNGFQG